MTQRLVVFSLLVGLIGAIVGYRLGAELREPMSLASPYTLYVETGSTLTGVATDLEADGIFEHPQLLSWYGRLTDRANRIRAGEYLLKPGLSPDGLLDMLVEGRVKLHVLTIVEGWTVVDLLAALRAHPAIQTTLDDPSPTELAAALELEAGHAEGLFFPDTYYFPRGTTDRELLLQARELMQQQLAESWAQRRAELPLANPYELLVLASIVERETALDRERPQVAGVFVRRLRKGMRLQTDPTVIYGLGAAFDGNLTRRDLQTDNPYNTYTRAGLPPTPIALPGKASLRAAANPDQGDALYFVATGFDDGSHTFTSSLEEHNAAVAAYLARLRQDRR